MKIYQAGTFTDRALKGNPAGVCILSESKEDEWMKNVAMEMNMSEAAFIIKKGDVVGQ